MFVMSELLGGNIKLIQSAGLGCNPDHIRLIDINMPDSGIRQAIRIVGIIFVVNKFDPLGI